MKETRRRFLKQVAAGGAAAGFPGLLQGQSPPRPNIIYILADDLGYGDLGCYGQKLIHTPHLDRLAREGLRFTQHYAGSTVCAPSRCSLMTGKHGGHCTIRGNVDVLLKPGEETLGKVLRRAGYRTACVGKWGIGHPPPPSDPKNNGFDHFFGYLSMWHAHNYYPDFLWRDGERVRLQNVVRHPSEHYKAGQAELVGLASARREYAPDLFTQDALAFLKQSPTPFFLFLSYTLPHANNEAALFGEHGMETPDYGAYAGEDWPAAEKGKAAMISRLDEYVGTLMRGLADLGLDRDTLVIFASDNGPHKEGGVDPEFFSSNGPLKGIKRDLYEGGIRVPMIARWPGKIRRGAVTEHVSAFWDVLPTIAELAGQDLDGGDGISFIPTLLGREQPEHEYLYWEFHEGRSSQAVRFEQWKAVRLAPSLPLEIYDLDKDVGETKNLAAARQDLVRRAEEILARSRTDEKTWPLREKAEDIPL